MISRVTYLHVALHEEVMHMSRYAPAAAGLSSSSLSGMAVEEPPDDPVEGDGGVEDGGNCEVNDGAVKGNEVFTSTRPTTQSRGSKSSHDYYDCWFEDEASGIPLRWQLFVGVLYDLMKGKAVLNSTSGKGGTNNQFILPWRIRVHFTSYPHDRLLPLDDGSHPHTNNDVDGSHRRITALVGRLFRNSLKQALFMQFGSSKVAMQITKYSHEKMWDAVLMSNFAAYHEVNVDLQWGMKSGPISSRSTDQDDQIDQLQLIPVRLMLNERPAIQNPIRHRKDETASKRRPSELVELNSSCQALPYTTLGDFLSNFCPNHFVSDTAVGRVTSVPGSCHYYSIQGLQPSLEFPLVDLWRALSHPDHFLYIIVVTE
jgi:autophagy-related protein 5